MKYVTIQSNIRKEISPFGGCFPLVKESDKSVWFIGKRGKTERLGKQNIWFICENDISGELESLNNAIQKSYYDHLKMVNTIIADTTTEYSQ